MSFRADVPYAPPLRRPSPPCGRANRTGVFPKLETFQEWYQGVVNAENQGGFVNVPLSDLEGEYLVVRPQAVIGVRVEPQFSSVDDA